MANKQICSVDVVDSVTDEDKILVNVDGKLRQIKVDNIPSKIDPEEFTATKQQIINNDLWNDTKSYVVGDLIIHNNVLYECIINNVGQMPPNTEYWKPRSLSDFNKEINKLNNSLGEFKYLGGGATPNIGTTISLIEPITNFHEIVIKYCIATDHRFTRIPTSLIEANNNVVRVELDQIGAFIYWVASINNNQVSITDLRTDYQYPDTWFTNAHFHIYGTNRKIS